MKTFICVLSISRPLNSLMASSLLISMTLWPNGECSHSTDEIQHIFGVSSHVIEILDIISAVFLCIYLLVWLKTLQTERTWRCWWWEHISYLFMQNNIKSKWTLLAFMINVLDHTVSIIIIIIIIITEVNINLSYHISHFSQSNQICLNKIKSCRSLFTMTILAESYIAFFSPQNCIDVKLFMIKTHQ